MKSLKETGGLFAASNLFAVGLIGLCGGVISGLFGVGGGVILVPAMVFFLGVSINTAIGTSLVVIVPTALIGAFKHYRIGNIDWNIVLALVPTALIGGYLGAWLTTQIPAAGLKRAFGAFLVLVGLRMLLAK